MVESVRISAHHHKRMPWANGRGQTIELLRYPARSSLDDMDWRVSVATLHEPGAFSTFPDFERTLLLLDPGEIVLSVSGKEIVLKQFEQVVFDGAGVSSLKALSQPNRDLNIMCRRGAWACDVVPFFIEDGLVTNDGDEVTAVWIFVNGSARDSENRLLEPLDLEITHDFPQWTGDGLALLVELRPIDRYSSRLG